jgi:hypothetical protein
MGELGYVRRPLDHALRLGVQLADVKGPKTPTTAAANVCASAPQP